MNAGDLVLVFVLGGAAIGVSVSDSQSNSYTQLLTASGAAFLYAAVASSTGTMTVTATWSQSYHAAIFAIAFSGFQITGNTQHVIGCGGVGGSPSNNTILSTPVGSLLVNAIYWQGTIAGGFNVTSQGLSPTTASAQSKQALDDPVSGWTGSGISVVWNSSANSVGGTINGVMAYTNAVGSLGENGIFVFPSSVVPVSGAESIAESSSLAVGPPVFGSEGIAEAATLKQNFLVVGANPSGVRRRRKIRVGTGSLAGGNVGFN